MALERRRQAERELFREAAVGERFVHGFQRPAEFVQRNGGRAPRLAAAYSKSPLYEYAGLTSPREREREGGERAKK